MRFETCVKRIMASLSHMQAISNSFSSWNIFEQRTFVDSHQYARLIEFIGCHGNLNKAMHTTMQRNDT